MRPLDPGKERREGARRSIGVMEVLEHQQDRSPLAEAAEHPEDPLEDAGLASLSRRDRRAARKRTWALLSAGS